MSYIRKGKVYLSTYWEGADIDSVVLRHRRGNDASKEERVQLYCLATAGIQCLYE
ncbi:hypothetical protein [Xenorhabdus siamensis]|uniref:hypothetical protein n=1 Tax=Xenorhabdus siamensis TaxID=3136254 RepID=UPI0030F38F24